MKPIAHGIKAASENNIDEFLRIRRIKFQEFQVQKNSNLIGFNKIQKQLCIPTTALIRAAEHRDIQLFQKLYKDYFLISKVNQFMFNVFVFGKRWHYQYKLPHLTYELDLTKKSLLHYCVFGNRYLGEDFFSNQVVPRLSRRQDNEGRTALMYASFYNQIDQCKVLLSLEGGQVDLNGQSAIFFAAKCCHLQIIELLLAKEGNITDNNGMYFYEVFPKSTKQTLIDKYKYLNQNYNTKQNKQSDQNYNELMKTFGIVTVDEQMPDYILQYKQFSSEIKEIKLKFSLMIDDYKQKLVSLVDQDFLTIQHDVQKAFDDFIPNYESELIQFKILFRNKYQPLQQLNVKQILQNKMCIFDQFDKCQKRLFSDRNSVRSINDARILKIFTSINQFVENIMVTCEMAFNELANQVEKRRTFFSSTLLLVNTIAVKDKVFAPQKTQCEQLERDLAQFSSIAKEASEQHFLSLAQQVQQSIDNKYEICLKYQVEDLSARIQAEQQYQLSEIESRKMKRVDRAPIVEIHRMIESDGKNKRSVFPNIKEIKTQLRSLRSHFLSQFLSKLKLQHLLEIYNFSRQYIADSRGLFTFVSANYLVPLEGNFASFEAVEDYFELYPHTLDYFDKEQLICAMLKQLIFNFTPQIQALFIAHSARFFAENCPAYKAAEKLCNKHENALNKKQKLAKTVINKLTEASGTQISLPEFAKQLFLCGFYAQLLDFKLDESLPTAMNGLSLLKIVNFKTQLPESITDLDYNVVYRLAFPRITHVDRDFGEDVVTEQLWNCE